jgi:hypothetical protein
MQTDNRALPDKPGANTTLLGGTLRFGNRRSNAETRKGLEGCAAPRVRRRPGAPDLPVRSDLRSESAGAGAIAERRKCAQYIYNLFLFLQQKRL